MIPLWISAYLLSVSAIGARQLVVHEAAEMILSSAVRVFSLTLNTTVLRSLPAGAEITTFLAPASMWVSSTYVKYVVKNIKSFR